MKKLICALLAVLLTFSLFGCNDADSPSESGDNSEITAEEFCKYLDENGYIKDVRALSFVDLPELSEFKISESDINFTKEDVPAQIDSLLKMFPNTDKNYVLQLGDTFNMDYSGKVDGVAFEGGTAQNVTKVAGDTSFVDNFLTKVTGHKIGETFDIEVTFPENYGSDELNGKLAIFTVTLNSVVPEYTDEWVKENADALETMLQVRSENTEELNEAVYDYCYRYGMESAIQALFGEMEVETLPENFDLYEHQNFEFSIRLNYDMTTDEWLEAVGATKEELEEVLRNDAVIELYLQAVCEKYEITASPEEYSAHTGKEDNSELIQTYGEPWVKHRVLKEKALELLCEKVTVTK